MESLKVSTMQKVCGKLSYLNVLRCCDTGRQGSGTLEIWRVVCERRLVSHRNHNNIGNLINEMNMTDRT